jgi:hypothetical protein
LTSTQLFYLFLNNVLGEQNSTKTNYKSIGAKNCQRIVTVYE